MTPWRNTCKVDKPRPGTGSPPGLRGRSRLQLSRGRLYVAGWKQNVRSGELHLRQEVLTRSRVADAAAFPSCSLLQWDFSRKKLTSSGSRRPVRGFRKITCGCVTHFNTQSCVRVRKASTRYESSHACEKKRSECQNVVLIVFFYLHKR